MNKRELVSEFIVNDLTNALNQNLFEWELTVTVNPIIHQMIIRSFMDAILISSGAELAYAVLKNFTRFECVAVMMTHYEEHELDN